MDELLMAEILPKFIILFRHGILGKAVLPMVDEIAPLWLNIRNCVRHPERAVFWPLVFLVRALLTAILETDNITDSLMDLSESAFQTSSNRWNQQAIFCRMNPILHCWMTPDFVTRTLQRYCLFRILACRCLERGPSGIPCMLELHCHTFCSLVTWKSVVQWRWSRSTSSGNVSLSWVDVKWYHQEWADSFSGHHVCLI